MPQNDIRGEYTESSASKQPAGLNPTASATGDVHARFASLVKELKTFLQGEGQRLSREEVAEQLGHLSAIGMPFQSGNGSTETEKH